MSKAIRITSLQQDELVRDVRGAVQDLQVASVYASAESEDEKDAQASLQQLEDCFCSWLSVSSTLGKSALINALLWANES